MMHMDRRSFAKSSGLLAGACLSSSTLAAHAKAAPEKGREPPFKLGMVTYNMAAKWDLPTLIKICKTVGIGPVELRTTHAHGVEPSLSPEERKKVRGKFESAGVPIWGLGSVCEFQAADQGVVPQEHRNLQVVRATGEGSWGKRRQGAAQWRCKWCSFREDAGADRQGAHRVRPGGIRPGRGDLGRSARQNHPESAQHAHHHGALRAQSVGLTWNSQSHRHRQRLGRRVVQVAVSLDSVVPYQ